MREIHLATDELSAQPGMGQCMITGKYVPEDELVTIQGYRVCAEGKAILLERLKAGDQMPGELEKPSVLLRFGCIFLDGLIFAIPAMVLAMVLVGGATLAAGRANAPLISGGITLVLTAAQLIYFGAMHAARGQTLGKMAGKIRVVNLDGSPISAKTAYVRALAYTWPNLVQGVLQLSGAPAVVQLASGILAVWSLADVITALINSQQRSLHDIIAGTRVVKNS